MTNEKKPYVIGLDLGGTNSVFGIVDANGYVVEQVSVKTAGHGPEPQHYVNDCVEALMPIIEKVGGLENIQGMGIGAPNANYYNGCIEFAPNLPWPAGKIPLAELFSKALGGLKVTITNDANAAAQGEMMYGLAKDMKNFIMITLGTGVGSGIVCDGKLIYGSDGLAGELGHVVVEPNGRQCGCGRKGCLETYCSATGVARTARQILTDTDEPSLLRNIPLGELESKHVSIAANQGDKVAKEIMDFTGHMLGIACSNFACFNSPEAFIFFGGLTKAGDLLMKPIKEAYYENILKCYAGKARFYVSELDDAKAAILGASSLGW